MGGLRRHFTSRTGPLQGHLTMLKLRSVTQLDTMVTGTVTSPGRSDDTERTDGTRAFHALRRLFAFHALPPSRFNLIFSHQRLAHFSPNTTIRNHYFIDQVQWALTGWLYERTCWSHWPGSVTTDRVIIRAPLLESCSHRVILLLTRRQ